MYYFCLVHGIPNSKEAQEISCVFPGGKKKKECYELIIFPAKNLFFSLWLWRGSYEIMNMQNYFVNDNLLCK